MKLEFGKLKDVIRSQSALQLGLSQLQPATVPQDDTIHSGERNDLFSYLAYIHDLASVW
jgi:hypothetical protein